MGTSGPEWGCSWAFLLFLCQKNVSGSMHNTRLRQPDLYERYIICTCHDTTPTRCSAQNGAYVHLRWYPSTSKETLSIVVPVRWSRSILPKKMGSNTYSSFKTCCFARSALFLLFFQKCIQSAPIVCGWVCCLHTKSPFLPSFISTPIIAHSDSVS